MLIVQNVICCSVLTRKTNDGVDPLLVQYLRGSTAFGVKSISK